MIIMAKDEQLQLRTPWQTIILAKAAREFNAWPN